MRRAGVEPNETTFSTTLTACSQSINDDFVVSLHGLVIKKGYLGKLFVSSGLVAAYSKSVLLDEARQVFDEMSHRDAVLWNLMISAYSQKGLSGEACNIFAHLTRDCNVWKVFVNDFTLASVLNACAKMGCLGSGKSVHNYAIKTGFDSNVFVGGAIVDMYCKCGRLDSARCFFDQMRNRDIVVWNTLITGYAQNNCEEEAIELFRTLECNGIFPNDTTFSCIIKASAVMLNGALGRCFHAKTLKFGFSLDVYVGTALIDMYSKFLTMDEAERAFCGMNKRNLVSYNALINGYSLIGRHGNALRAYTELRNEEMIPDSFTLIGLFSSCAASSAFAEGSQVHSHSIMLGLDSNASVGNSIVNFYSSCASVDCALKVFESIKQRNAISWAGIISGLVQNNKGEKAIELFCKMHKLSGGIDEFSSSSVIKAVATCTATEQGRNLHAHVLKMGLQSKIYVGSALIDMYSKCGMVEDAYKVFSKMPERNVVSWNSMIMGYAQNGFSNDALLLYQEMKDCEFAPTPVTFVGILLACNHAGLVQEGRHYYRLMVNHYGIPASIEHCTCMVYLLGHAGYVEEAEELLLNSPFSEEPGIWRSLLASCEAHENFQVAFRAAQYCLRFEPDDSSAHTILSNIYAAKQLWPEVESARDSMKLKSRKQHRKAPVKALGTDVIRRKLLRWLNCHPISKQGHCLFCSNQSSQAQSYQGFGESLQKLQKSFYELACTYSIVKFIQKLDNQSLAAFVKKRR
ncbi:hypothetical protein Nepgr_008822 [Nepenthes gracilis]|uniref:Pentatricopeptide repeat-containing protein n=1 Tax=Nepenthes gracilis TaxID=150966 RepID=A0AAD3S9N1_NEPGR|nr:hypothetical protein Nepgr_008822 [Nepenthes gracilis]